MSLLNLQGVNPSGDPEDIPITGVVEFRTQPLSSNEVWSSAWAELKGANALRVAISSNQKGSYTIEFSMDGANQIDYAIAPIAYDPAVVKPFQFAIDPKAKYFRLVYTNGPIAQTEMYAEIKFYSGNVQPTLRSVGAPTTASQLAMITKGPIEAPATATNINSAFLQPTASVSGSNVGLDVNVLNPSSSPETGLAKDSTLKDGTTKVQVTNFPSSQTVTVSNPTTNPETGLAKDATLTNSSQKSQIVNGSGTTLGTATNPLGIRLSDGTVYVDPRQVRALTAADVVTVANLPMQPNTAVVTTYTPATGTTITTIAANSNRKGLTIFSVSGTFLIKFGAGASPTSVTSRIVTNGLYELPAPIYTGVVTVYGQGTFTTTESV